MHIQAYFDRIGYTGDAAADLDTLRTLHRAHLRTIPFENLGIHQNRDIVLSEPALFEKIVRGGRGGICYELNALFCGLLAALGFDVTMLAARVHVGEAELTPDFDHLVLLVRAGGNRYLADVGFGDSFLFPLDLDSTAIQSDGASAYRVSSAGEHVTVLRKDSMDADGPFVPVFRFDLQPRVLADFHDRCRFHQQSPHSHFRRRIVCTRADIEGRVTIRGDRLTLTKGGQRIESPLATQEQIDAALDAHFGIILTPR